MDFTRAKPHRDVCETVRAVYASTLSTKAEERGVEVIGMDSRVAVGRMTGVLAVF
jgi:hypothetical protein